MGGPFGAFFACFNHSAEEVYEHSIESTDDLKSVNKAHFIEGYNLQTKELSHILKKTYRAHHF